MLCLLDTITFSSIQFDILDLKNKLFNFSRARWFAISHLHLNKVPNSSSFRFCLVYMKSGMQQKWLVIWQGDRDTMHGIPSCRFGISSPFENMKIDLLKDIVEEGPSCLETFPFVFK